MDNTAIKVDHISKTFKLPHEKVSSIKAAVVNFYRRNRSYEQQQVLRNISFEVKKGEFFGIVGRNGSGKSTLLKLLAGIYTPNSGNLTVKGRLTPFIELGVGFNPELTGRENVFLNGALLGFSRKEMAALYDDIVAFAELERFMDQKLKNYSSGMQVRLAFSIAIRAKSDVLLIDEVLAVGDANFQKKCYQYFYKLKNEGQTVVLVTHDMGAVKNFCDKAMLIDKGKIVLNGSATKVAEEYSLLNLTNGESASSTNRQWGTGELRITDCTVKLSAGRHYYKPHDDIIINVSFEVKKAVEKPIVGITIKDMTGREVFVTNTKALSITNGNFTEGQIFEASFRIKNVFNDGTYTVTPAIADSNMTESYAGIEDACQFEVMGWPFPTGILQAPTEFSIKTLQKGKK